MSTLFKSLFQKPEEIPPELKDLTPQQIVDKIKSLQAQETEFSQLKNASAQQKQELDSVRQQLDDVKKKSTPPKSDDPPPTPSILEDEDAAFAARLGPTHTAALTANAQVAQMRAEQHITQDSIDSRLLRKYKKEVDQLFFSQPLASQVNPNTYVACFERVVGAKRSEINSLRGTENDPFVESVGGGAPPLTPKKDVLSDDELRTAKRLGVSPEKYLETKKNSVHVAA